MKNIKKRRSCILPEGKFTTGCHHPFFHAVNLRVSDHITHLGQSSDHIKITNKSNFPEDKSLTYTGSPVYEIPNAFDFRGTSYIGKDWADKKVNRPEAFLLQSPKTVSFATFFLEKSGNKKMNMPAFEKELQALPAPLKIALAKTSTDPIDLIALANLCCRFVTDEKGINGLNFKTSHKSKNYPDIKDPELFEVIINNPYLPDNYKYAMVLKPGIQGDSPVIGEYLSTASHTHVWEYLRSNSYIPWGHYAANMAHDAIRYHAKELSFNDMSGLRHLYYQRVFVRVSKELNLLNAHPKLPITPHCLEEMRKNIEKALGKKATRSGLTFTSTLWGWNYGFDYSATGYRLGASHQQIHQQFALIPKKTTAQLEQDEKIDSFSMGDLIHDFITNFEDESGVSFFNSYEKALKENNRTDNQKNGESELVIFEDEAVLLFVPKAQTSQYEIQLMPKEPIGNILEAPTRVRDSLDKALAISIKLLTHMGIQMITTIECSKRFDILKKDQRLLYMILPRMPYSPGGFSEAQLRWISGHYPEDFASALRYYLDELGLIK